MPSVLLDYPLLSPGDQMGRDEFLGRWYQMPGLKFAELIEGAVLMPSPLSLRHANRGHLIQGLLFSYGTCARLPALDQRNMADDPNKCSAA